MKSSAPDGRSGAETGEKYMKLHQLKNGQKATLFLRADGDAAETELLRRGISPTAEVLCLFSAPSGDPTAYRMGKVTFALRRETAEKIAVFDRENHTQNARGGNSGQSGSGPSKRDRNGISAASSEKRRPRR